MPEGDQRFQVERRFGRWAAIFALVGFVFAWELLYYLGLIDRLRFPHLKGVLQVLGDVDFLGGFAVMLLQLAFASLSGGAIGFALGTIIIRSHWWTQSTLRFLRIGLWIPFLVGWPLPIWPPREGYWFGAFFWVWIAVVEAVTLSSCYHYLAARSTLALDPREARPRVVRETILQALFISLISQRWLSPYGWNWFFFPASGGAGPAAPAEAYAATVVLLVVFLFLVERVFRSAFDDTARARATILAREVSGRDTSTLWGAVLIGVACLILWQSLSTLGFYSLISSPLDVLKAGYRLIIIGTTTDPTVGRIWTDIGISLLEVFGGLFFGGGVAFIVSKRLSSSLTFRASVLPLLQLTYIVPFVLSLFVMIYWGGSIAPWRTALGVALLTFYPFLQVFWGLRDYPLPCCFLLAMDDALPFAFVAMVFGEAINSVGGLGFFIVMAGFRLHLAEGIAAALLTVALLFALSSTLRWVGKRLYFREGVGVESLSGSPNVG